MGELVTVWYQLIDIDSEDWNDFSVGLQAFLAEDTITEAIDP